MSKCAVIVSRNDNYGENLVTRAKHCIYNLTNVFDKIVYVDWKLKHKALTDNFTLPDNVHVIRITEEVIKKNWPQYINYPVVETVGRNIGIRYAIDDGQDWICSTNIDIIMNSFDCEGWDQNTLYTARRRNIEKEVYNEYKDTNDLLNFINHKKDNFDIAPLAVVNGKGVWDPGDHWSLAVCCGDFQMAHRELWGEIRGFEEEMGGRCYADSNLMKRPILIGKKTAIADVDVFHLNHNNFSEREEEEFLPLNDQTKYVTNWAKSTNTINWGTFS